MAEEAVKGLVAHQVVKVGADEYDALILDEHDVISEAGDGHHHQSQRFEEGYHPVHLSPIRPGGGVALGGPSACPRFPGVRSL